MTRIDWDKAPKLYDDGVDRGVLYLDQGAVPWNGLVNVNEKEVGNVDVTYYYDGIRFFVNESSDAYQADISAFTYPEVFSEYNGVVLSEAVKRFGLSYRTQHADEYRIHLVYGARIRGNGPAHETVKDVGDPNLFSWNVSTIGVDVENARPTSHMILDSRQLEWVTRRIEDIIYGTDETDPRLPTPDELYELYEAATDLRIRYNYDGSYTASGDDELLQVHGDGSFTINSPSALKMDDGLFSVRSYAR